MHNGHTDISSSIQTGTLCSLNYGSFVRGTAFTPVPGDLRGREVTLPESLTCNGAVVEPELPESLPRAEGSCVMLPVGEVLPGVVVFLDCGCLGRRGISPPDAAVLVIIEKPCTAHGVAPLSSPARPPKHREGETTHLRCSPQFGTGLLTGTPSTVLTSDRDPANTPKWPLRSVTNVPTTDTR